MTKRGKIGGANRKGLALALALSSLAPMVGHARGAGFQFNIPSENLQSSLRAFAKTTGAQIIFDPTLAKACTGAAVQGNYSAEDGLKQLLRNSGMTYRRSPTGVLLVVLASEPPPPVAPANTLKTPSPTPPEPVTVVIVTGIRGAILHGLEGKRNSNHIVESIQSEDIGKFPDANLAEALQRLAGVAIDRDGGEGRYVTVRGFGPAFNPVLVNGRRIATSEGSRSFGFDTISSDLVGGINLYKTQPVWLPEGGIGGTIDLRTMRPLDRKGYHAMFRMEGNYEENSDKTSPNASLLVSNTFMDDKVGLLLDVSYQRRENRTYQAGGNLLRSIDSFAAATPLETDPAMTVPFTYGNFGYASAYKLQELDRNVLDEVRTRKGISGDVQYRPNDDFEFNLDFLYSDFSVDTDMKQVGNWFYELEAPAGSADEIRALDPTNPAYQAYADYIAQNSITKVDENGVITKARAINGLGSQAFNGERRHRPTVTEMVGANLKWRLSDKLTLTLDGAYSTADQNNKGLDQRRSFENTFAGTFIYDNTTGIPFLTDLSPDLTASMTNTSNLHLRANWDMGTDIQAANKDISAQLTWQGDERTRIRAGVVREVGEKTTTDYQTPVSIRYLYSDGNLTNLTPAQLSTLVYGVYTSDPSQFGMPSNADNNTFLINYEAIDAFFADPVNLAALSPAVADRVAYFVAHGSTLAALPTGTGFEVNEGVTSLYADLTKTFKLWDREAVLTAGLRYSQTETYSAGYSLVLTSLSPDPSDPTGLGLLPAYADADGPEGLNFLTAHQTYADWLPSVNLKINASDTIVVRFAASKSLTRPDLDYLAPNFTYGTLTTAVRTASTNNPDLKPIKSSNLDTAAEWYYGRGNAVTFDAFFKRVEGMIVSQTTADQVIDTVQPAQYNTFLVTRPTNASTANVWGATVGWTHNFDFGLGFQANYTWTDTNRPFDPDSYNATKVALPGLSDTANAVIYYEHGPISARLAYNWRSKFLSNPAFPGGAIGSVLEPEFTEAYHQIDARVGVNVGPRVQIYLEAVNLEKSAPKQVGRYDNIFISRSNYGRRIIAGFSVKY